MKSETPDEKNPKLAAAYNVLRALSEDEFGSWLRGKPVSPAAYANVEKKYFSRPITQKIADLKRRAGIANGSSISKNALRTPSFQTSVNGDHDGPKARAACKNGSVTGGVSEVAPSVLIDSLRASGPVAFPSGEVADGAWEFGRLEQLPSEEAEVIIETIAERAYNTLPRDFRSKAIVIVCFSYPIHRCGKRLAAKIIERNGTEAHVVLATNFFEPRLRCADRELEEQNIIIFVDVVHSGGLINRLAEICNRPQPKQVLRMTVIDQGDNPKRKDPITALWKETREGRTSIQDYLQNSDKQETLRFYDPEFARAFAKQDLPEELADRSTARETIELEIAPILPFIFKTDALQADRTIAGVHYSWVIDLLRLLEDGEARAFLLTHAIERLAHLPLSGRCCLVYPAERSQRAGKWARLIGKALDWPVVAVGQANRKCFQPLTAKQRQHLSQFDVAVVVDAAVRTGNTLRSFVQLLKCTEKPVVQRICGFYAFDGLFEADRRAILEEVGVTILSLVKLPLGRPIRPIGQYCREQMRAALRTLEERYPNTEPAWTGLIRNYCNTKLGRHRWQPRPSGDAKRRLTDAMEDWQRGPEARLERSCYSEKPSVLKQLDVQFALHEPKTRMVLRGFLSNSMPPEFIEWCALAVASQYEYDWLDTDWLLLHENLLAAKDTQRWKFLAYIFYVMKTRANTGTITRVRLALQKFAANRRASAPTLFPHLDTVQTRCEHLEAILAESDIS